MQSKQVEGSLGGLRDSLHAPGYKPGSRSSSIRQPRVSFCPTNSGSSPDPPKIESLNALVHRRSGMSRPPPLSTGNGEGSDRGCAGPSRSQPRISGSPVTPPGILRRTKTQPQESRASGLSSPVNQSPTSPSRYKPHNQRDFQSPARDDTPIEDQTGRSPTSPRSSPSYSYQICNSNGPIAGHASPKGKRKSLKLMDSVAEQASIEGTDSVVLDPSNSRGQSSQSQTRTQIRTAESESSHLGAAKSSSRNNNGELSHRSSDDRSLSSRDGQPSADKVSSDESTGPPEPFPNFTDYEDVINQRLAAMNAESQEATQGSSFHVEPDAERRYSMGSSVAAERLKSSSDLRAPTRGDASRSTRAYSDA